MGDYLIWDAIDCSGKTAQMLADSAAFDFKHVFTLIKKQNEHTNFYHFGTHLTDPAIHQTYINNLDLLDRFITFFNAKVGQSKALSRAYDTILNADQTTSKVELNNRSAALFNNQPNREIILQTLLSPAHQLLTASEIQCAELILQGKTAKEIAKEMCLSYRTIEDRIDSLKNKFNAKNKAELIVKLLGTEL
ncbi:helix-turn-helix transcriptional regulator [Legionella dresdenensis]|uniref:Helix-turn-helix transcriptional regulator n=1 Tax=Legionella dresdenensis TaxID=450200 RepID=A0ABV8CHI3_9GAMM